MKKQLTIFLFLISISTTVFAESFDIGGKEIMIPPPEGYVRVTPEMDVVYRLSMQMADPVNDLLAYYISESDASTAMKGDIPKLERTFALKVNKRLKGMIVGSNNFSDLKSMTKQQNQQIYNSVKSQLPDYLDQISKDISKEFDVDFAMQVSQMVPLDAHYESDNALAYSMYINYGVATKGSDEKLIVSATATYVNTSGKVLFLYCYGPKSELEWTRSASKAWAEAIMAGNSLPPKETSVNRGINWSEVAEKGIIGAMIGGLIALVMVFLKKRKKKG